MVPRVYIHAGHGKTGSSFLQSSLALSTDRLEAENILYPDLSKNFEAARAGDITSGNLPSQRMTVAQAMEQMADAGAGDNSVLFSNEFLFYRFLNGNEEDILEMSAKGQIELRVLCFIRDPLDHAVSVYQQTIKRSGNTKPFSEFLKHYRIPGKVELFVKRLTEAKAKVQIANYTRNRDRVPSVMETWLGLAEGTLDRPGRLVVNRSMTNAELALQAQFNHHLGKRASVLISDPLCNALPDIKSEYPAIRLAELAPFLKRMRAQTAQTNALLPEQDRYQVPDDNAAIAKFKDPDDPMLLSFSEAQIKVLAEHLTQVLQKLGWK